ncbi:MAG: hypothetical protein KatS3mg110_1889 [Pirellulaceae bacterium]|nr:MAG: hypothetical protein KatS3mg110_1889 [Pirellulaceae bacterium]
MTMHTQVTAFRKAACLPGKEDEEKLTNPTPSPPLGGEGQDEGAFARKSKGRGA